MKFLWLDLETTGLDPNRDLVLEVAMVLTDASFKKIAEYQSVVYRSADTLDALNINARVVDMHTMNGLWEDLKHGKPADVVAEEMDLFARKHQVYRGNRFHSPPRLAGNSVHFDRRFLERFAPKFVQGLFHRHMDMSSVMEASAVWAGRDISVRNDGVQHRAMDDVMQSIAQAMRFREVFKNG